MRGVRVAIAAAVMAVVLSAGSGLAQVQQPEWQRQYLRGLELEDQGQYRAAAEHFAAAETLHPHAQRNVDFGEAGPMDYDPYYHGARCVGLAGGSLAIVRRLALESARAGVTPRPLLEELRREIRRKRGLVGTPAPTPFWEQPRPLRPPRREPGRRPPPSGASAAAPTPRSTPTPTATPRPAPATIDLGDLPADAVVTVDGKRYPKGTRRVTVAPGRHALKIEVRGGVALQTTVRLRSGEVLRPVIPVDLTVPTATPPPEPTLHPSPSPVPTPAPVRPSHSNRLGAVGPFVLVALAVVVVVVLLLRRRRTPESALETTPTRRITPADEASVETPGSAGGVRRTAMAGRTFGNYVVEDRLGSGGMATTYLARRASDGTEVALKVPHEHCLDDESFRQRFLREGRLGSQLHHPNIVRILEAGEEDGTPFLAMELVRGTTLRELLRTAGGLPLAKALDLARQVAEALDYAHSKGVIHRDLKPENLMILPDGRLVVMDFGIARVEGGAGLTATSVFVGTPAYAAPEAIGGGPVDHRIDLYALGILMLEMLEGGLPFAGSSPLEQLQAHLEGKLPARAELDRAIPDDVWKLIEGLTAREPAERFGSAEAFLVALREVLRHREQGGTPFA